MYLVKSPLLLKWYYPSLVWNMPRSEKVIYLTFDDGPIPNVTDFVLKTLKAFNAKATFFCIGDNITKHPDVFNRVKNDGHAIGNHTFNHLKGWETDDETYISNFQKCQELTGTNLFRPPYGRIRKSQARSLKSGAWGLEHGGESGKRKAESEKLKAQSSKLKAESELLHTQNSALNTLNLPPKTQNSQLTTQNSKLPVPLNIIMWDVLSGDFDLNLSPEKCYQNVIRHTENGSIVVFHDSLKAFDRLEYTLPKVLSHFSERGYLFKSL